MFVLLLESTVLSCKAFILWSRSSDKIGFFALLAVLITANVKNVQIEQISE